MDGTTQHGETMNEPNVMTETDEYLDCYERGYITETQVKMVLTPEYLTRVVEAREKEIDWMDGLVTLLAGTIIEQTDWTVGTLSTESGISPDRLYRWIKRHKDNNK
jgi:hypothetical protein